MKGDMIIVDGSLTSPASNLPDFDLAMESNYIYTHIHTEDYRPYHLSHAIEYAERSSFALYGERFELDARRIEANIRELLAENHYPMGSACVTLYLFPSYVNKLRELNEKRHYVLSCRQQLLYRGYTNWHTGARAIIVPYEYPFSQHRTAVSLASHTYAEHYARKQGADAAIRESYEGALMSVGDAPLFAVNGDALLTTPTVCGTADCVERELMRNIARDLAMEFRETPLLHGALRSYEELFYVTTQGVHHIAVCDGMIYPNIVARKVGIAMSKNRG